jgi:hypothetical protein
VHPLHGFGRRRDVVHGAGERDAFEPAEVVLRDPKRLGERSFTDAHRRAE